MTQPPRGPILIDLDEAESSKPDVTPATAPPVPDSEMVPADPAAMQRLATMAAQPRNRLAMWFWGLLVSLIGFFASVALWQAVAAMIASNPVLGAVATVLLGAFLLVCAGIFLREAMAFFRLSRLDKVQTAAKNALANHDLGEARKIVSGLAAFYQDRPELRLGRDSLKGRLEASFDADAVIGLGESDLLAPLDAAAVKEIEIAARQVATVTAIVPLALADLFTALTANMRMIRRVAEIYGGRAGTLGTWRLTRAVLTHLVATGAVAVGDDLIGSIAGGSALSKLSRRFGEGVVNGALTARVGVAALEVCRPLPFTTTTKPSVTGLVRRALTGLFGGN